MNPVALYFASGDSLYAGAAILFGLLLLAIFGLRFPMLRARNILAWLGFVLIVISSPPLPWIVDGLFLLTFLVWFFAADSAPKGSKGGWRTAISAVFFALLLGITVLEFSRRAMPEIIGPSSDHLVVIGDSISSGIDSRVAAWPAVFQRESGIPMKNLAKAGALTFDGISMAKAVKPDDQVVLLEIGGNDLLSGIPAAQFAENLEIILSHLHASPRTVVMFELPLVPSAIAYGQIQRRLAAKYGVWLIPKHHFADVLSGADATSDGLHLSVVGAHRMAALVNSVLIHVVKASQSSSTGLGNR